MQNIDEQSVAVVKGQVTKMQKMIDEYQITDEKSLAVVNDKIALIKQLTKAIEQKKKSFTDPANAILKEARATFDPYIKECKNGEVVLKQRAIAYHRKQEDERRKEEERIAARVEKGTMKEETAMAKLEKIKEPVKTVRTDQGAGLNFRKRRVAVIENPSQVPDEYWIIDEVRVRREAIERDKNGTEQIPGVVVREEDTVASV